MDWTKQLCTTRVLDQNFGMCISPQDILIPFFNNQGTNYFRPWKLCEEIAKKDFGSTIDNTADKLKIILDVQHFKPTEINVKVNDKEIIIEGKHEERQDQHGFISRKFVRKYALPKDCPSESVISTLSSDGVLTVIANKETIKEIKEGAKPVPIKMEGPCRKTDTAEEKKITTSVSEAIRSDKCETKKESDKCDMKKESDKCDMKKESDKCDMKKESDKCDMKKESDKCDMLKESDKCEMKKECEMKKSDIIKESAKSDVTKESDKGEMKKQCEIKKDDKDKKECRPMLKEEHSRLLKPELLGEAVTGNTEKLLTESKKETDELLKLISADKTVLNPTAEKLDEAIDQCKTAINELKKEKSEANTTAMSEMSSIVATEISSMKSSMMSEKIETSMSSNMKATSEKTSDIVSEIICAELKEAAAENM